MSVITTKVDIDATMKNVGEIARQMYEIQDEINRAKNAIVETLELMDEDLFWALMDNLKKSIKASGNHKIGVERFIHNASYGHVAVEGKFTEIMDVLRFLKTYEAKVGALYKPLFKVIEGYGDDSYSDMIDSFPLFGRERYEKALKGEIEGDSENQYQGENYIRTTMDNALNEKFAGVCRSIDDEEDEE